MKKLIFAITSSLICMLILTSCNSTSYKQAGSTDSAALSNSHLTEQIRDIPSSELVKEIRIGWSLGNTLDSTIGIRNADISEYETGWGNPPVTKDIIDSVSEAGFNILRIPVSWDEHLSSDGKYTIDPDWLRRVGEVVDYGIDNGMFVILNTHHEDWIFPSDALLEQNKAQLTAVWTQIGSYFEGYDEHLIFEGMNEPRKKGTAAEWTGGDSEGQECVNQLNQTFIDTIRSLSGNNPKRHLMIPTYAASSTDNAINAFTVPDDDKIIVSVHAYIPYSFALQDSGTDKWSADDPSCTYDIDHLMEILDHRFISNGVPVIIGEMGATYRSNDDARCEWAEYYIKKASQSGIPCLWWDNGVYIGKDQVYGLLSRKSGSWIYRDLVDALMNGL